MQSVVKLKKQFNFIATQIDTKKTQNRFQPGKRFEMEVSNCEYFDYIWFDLIWLHCDNWKANVSGLRKKMMGRKLWEIMGKAFTCLQRVA